jgi:poly(A) polymerase
MLRCASEEAPAELGEWWTRFLHAEPQERAELIARSETSAPARRRRRRGGRRDGAAAA